ncbi:hypothetical protein PI125_g9478 [Phytophthora idaei]|nr:hypothetical protein PI125_g9478 [Phytophthora idaei]
MPSLDALQCYSEKCSWVEHGATAQITPRQDSRRSPSAPPFRCLPIHQSDCLTGSHRRRQSVGHRAEALIRSQSLTAISSDSQPSWLPTEPSGTGESPVVTR